MDIALKLKILDRIYAIYDKFAASLDLACKKGCDHCCTADLILTTLEGYNIIERLSTDTDIDVIQRIRDASQIKRLRPQLTTNRLAQLCSEVTKAYLIETAAEIKTAWLKGKQHIGITAGASTAEATIDEVVTRLKLIT